MMFKILVNNFINNLCHDLLLYSIEYDREEISYYLTGLDIESGFIKNIQKFLSLPIFVIK